MQLNGSVTSQAICIIYFFAFCFDEGRKRNEKWNFISKLLRSGKSYFLAFHPWQRFGTTKFVVSVEGNRDSWCRVTDLCGAAFEILRFRWLNYVRWNQNSGLEGILMKCIGECFGFCLENAIELSFHKVLSYWALKQCLEKFQMLCIFSFKNMKWGQKLFPNKKAQKASIKKNLKLF